MIGRVLRHGTGRIGLVLVLLVLALALVAPALSDPNRIDVPNRFAEPSLDRVVRASYELLGLLSFFTVGEDEVRAWTIRRGTVARDAAGTIHSDIARGFIRAEVVYWEELVRLGSLAACRDAGVLRLEGKEYLMRDGDVAHFRFNV